MNGRTDGRSVFCKYFTFSHNYAWNKMGLFWPSGTFLYVINDTTMAMVLSGSRPTSPFNDSAKSLTRNALWCNVCHHSSNTSRSVERNSFAIVKNGCNDKTTSYLLEFAAAASLFYQKRGPSYILPYFLRPWPTPCSLLTDTINNKINQSVINWVHEPNTVEVHWPNFFAWGSFAGKFRWIIVINDDMLHLANKRHFAKRRPFPETEVATTPSSFFTKKES